MTAFADYLAAIKKNRDHDDATEHTHRPALKTLLEAVDKGTIATNEPTRILCGAPDFNITRKKVPIGHVETKDVGVSLDAIERDGAKATPATHDGEQFKRYLTLPNWILTDYLEFRWFVGGEKRLTARIGEIDARGKLKALPDGEEKLAQLLNAFFKQKALTIGTAKELAQRMAGMTRIIRDLIVNTFEHEKEQGWLHNWLAAFRETLIPDLDEAKFADMFAQTLAYGLFAARVHTPPKKEFSREMAAFNLPKTNPFLRKLFSEIAGVDMPETIDWAVDDVVELLKHADMFEILKDFGKGKGREDPVVHFYETFLAAYDPKMREVRGVYYTPEPVVSYIVRSIEHLLKTRFNRLKGLADENTLILDPATGTGTFLYFVVNQIYEKFAKQKGAWDSYVDKHLLNRLFGFELLVAPYAVAHLKLGMQLADLGYSFRSDQRLGIYLTNTLEEAAKRSERLFAQWIADEANAAAKIKRDEPILVVVGNPPYSGQSANRSDEVIQVEKGARYLSGLEIEQGKLVPHWKTAKAKGEITIPNFIGRLLLDYYVVDGAWLDERQPKWLQDDYVKFIRFAQWRVDRTGEGIIGFITNHGYLDNPTFRGMRQSLMRSFNEIHVYDLHGNSKKKERCPDGTKDENVFDIQQGVAILLCVKKKDDPTPCQVFHADLQGVREVFETVNGEERLVKGKYHTLLENNVETTKWEELQVTPPYYLFLPQDNDVRAEYEHGWCVPDIMLVNNVGFVTARDSFLIDFDQDQLRDRIQEFRTKEADTPTSEIESKYRLKSTSSWNLREARDSLRTNKAWNESFAECLYRPFDTRHIYYSPKMIERPVFQVQRHMLSGENCALVMPRRVETQEGWKHILAANRIIDHVAVSSKSVDYAFPLYLYPDEGELSLHTDRRPNFSAAFLKALAEKLGLPQTEPHGMPKGITPEDIFYFAYATFYSPAYRTRYAESLKKDFPRLPLISDVKLFAALAAKGAELVALHLMESPKLEDCITEFPAKGSNEVEKVQYTDKDNRVWINTEQYFSGVPKAVWEFHIGGYQVCEKWLKDRKGRKLSYDDTEHYQKIIVALNETIRLMNEIDALIPGWPLQ